MGTLDLALVRTFNALYETQSVTKAAGVLSITQPSVSYSLARLRKQLGDPLFIRGKKGMSPTARAIELYDVFSRSIAAIDACVDSVASFDPATSSRTFRICLSDLGELSFLPAIMKQLNDEAPGVILDVLPMQIGEVSEWLRHGRVDAAIASVPLPGLERCKVLASDRYVCVLPSGWRGSAERLTLEEFASLRHAVIDQAAGHHQVDAVMERLGVLRRPSLRLHHFAVLPNLLTNSNLTAIVPLQVAQMFSASWPVSVKELPFEVPSFDVSLYWNEATSRSESIRWFLDLVTRTLADAGD